MKLQGSAYCTLADVLIADVPDLYGGLGVVVASHHNTINNVVMNNAGGYGLWIDGDYNQCHGIIVMDSGTELLIDSGSVGNVISGEFDTVSDSNSTTPYNIIWNYRSVGTDTQIRFGPGTDVPTQTSVNPKAHLYLAPLGGDAMLTLRNNTDNVEAGMFTFAAGSACYAGSWSDHKFVIRQNNADVVTFDTDDIAKFQIPVTATSYNGLTLTTTTGTFTLSNSKVLTVSNTLTFSGTDSSSVAFGAGGTIGAVGYSATGQVAGTATNDDAAAGKVGEYAFSQVLVGSAVSMTTATDTNITSMSLTAGDWDVSGTVATSVAAGTTTTIVQGWVTTTSATLPTSPAEGGLNKYASSIPAGQNVVLPTGTRRFSLSGTTTIYLGARATFATDVLSGYGYLRARRVR
jgi:hypothetical protein